MKHACGLVAAGVLALVVGGVAEARPRPRPGAELTPADLAWPATATSAEARGQVEVFRKPGKGRLGRLARGTRVTWTRIVAGGGACRAYLAIEPRGWVCAKELAPSAQPPQAGLDPARVVAAVEAKVHAGVVPHGADAFATRVAVEAAQPTKKAPGWAFLHADTPIVRIAARRYYRTRHGYIAAKDVEPRTASTFAGVDLRATAAPWPLAWVTPRRRGDAVVVRAAAAASAAQVGTLARRDRVAVLEERDGFVRIDVDRWVSRDELRVARTAPRPRGVGDAEGWIDVDLDEQVLVAYEGDRPVYATLVSSGLGRSTPTAIHRIAEKRMTARMKSPEVALGKWDMPDVPFAMTFRRHYALHGAYWHDSFGKKRSHGCVNLAPRDARFLFEWTYPRLPAGWIAGQTDADDGTPIRLRNRKNPDPDWVDFDAPPPVPTKETPPADDE